MNNLNCEFEDFLKDDDFENNLVIEEVKALIRGAEAYCFNNTQLKLIKEWCKKYDLNITYKKNKDDIFILTPLNAFKKSK